MGRKKAHSKRSPDATRRNSLTRSEPQSDGHETNPRNTFGPSLEEKVFSKSESLVSNQGKAQAQPTNQPHTASEAGNQSDSVPTMVSSSEETPEEAIKKVFLENIVTPINKHLVTQLDPLSKQQVLKDVETDLKDLKSFVLKFKNEVIRHPGNEEITLWRAWEQAIQGLHDVKISLRQLYESENGEEGTLADAILKPDGLLGQLLQSIKQIQFDIERLENRLNQLSGKAEHTEIQLTEQFRNQKDLLVEYNSRWVRDSRLAFALILLLAVAIALMRFLHL